ncbi:MAG: cytochrome b N-terminal domain-containing protein [Myxococcota bacterium]
MSLRGIGQWIDQRLAVGKIFEATAGHHIPASSASWFYVFGSGTLLCFILQIVTGICLALIYVPSPDQAYQSLEYLNYEQPLGWFVRAIHYWGSNFMLALMTIHLIQVFLFGAYKYPRELTWLFGCVLFLATLGAAFTGQVMRFDQDAYWGLGIGVSILGRLPLIGPEMVHGLLGGPIIGGEALSRFFTLHVFVIPGLLIGVIVLHLRGVLTQGINEFPVAGKGVDPATYDAEYKALVERDGVRFAPDGIDKDVLFAAFVLLAIFLCAIFLGPKGPNGPPDPTFIHTAPRPDFYFLSLFSVLALLPPYMETAIILYVLPVFVVILFAIPFIAGTGEKHPSRRPGAVVGVVVVMTILATLAWLGTYSPWSPHMNAWSGVPTPIAMVKGRSPLELQGAALLQAKQCRNCHSLDGEGGLRGPDLTTVATRLTKDQMIRQVLQGGGNMPAYRKHLKPSEVTALVSFLETLHPTGEPASRNSAAANP